MDTVDQEVLKQLVNWVKEDKVCFLATIVKTFSSSPRPVGSLMALTLCGNQIGSLSGGCVEEELARSLKESSTTTFPHLYLYGVTSEESARLGLPCGGQMEVIVERLDNKENYLHLLEEVLARIEQHLCVSRTLDLKTAEVAFSDATATERLKQPITLTDHSLKQILGPAFRLLIVGSNQVARYLADFALALNYRVLICDPRPEAIASLKYLDGVEFYQQMPDDFILEQKPDQQSAVVTVTHDPKIDDLALIEALDSNAFYVGAMGSVKTSENRKKRLLNMTLINLSAEQIDFMRAPVGLSIGSKTPPEIALSIMAELTQLRSQAGMN